MFCYEEVNAGVNETWVPYPLPLHQVNILLTSGFAGQVLSVTLHQSVCFLCWVGLLLGHNKKDLSRNTHENILRLISQTS